MYLEIFFRKLKLCLCKVQLILAIQNKKLEKYISFSYYKKNILNKRIIKNWTNFISHFYYIVLDIRKFDPMSEKYSRKIRVINFYNNKIGNRYV